jgi:hypothetical protein
MMEADGTAAARTVMRAAGVGAASDALRAAGADTAEAVNTRGWESIMLQAILLEEISSFSRRDGEPGGGASPSR